MTPRERMTAQANKFLATKFMCEPRQFWMRTASGKTRFYLTRRHALKQHGVIWYCQVNIATGKITSLVCEGTVTLSNQFVEAL